MPPSTTENPYVFEDQGGRGSSEEQPFDGTVVLRVFADACPRTSKNFSVMQGRQERKGPAAHCITRALPSIE